MNDEFKRSFNQYILNLKDWSAPAVTVDKDSTDESQPLVVATVDRFLIDLDEKLKDAYYAADQKMLDLIQKELVEHFGKRLKPSDPAVYV